MNQPTFHWIPRNKTHLSSAEENLLEALLISRGISGTQDTEKFLYPKLNHLADPFKIPGCEAAVDRIWAALKANESICIYGDYDVDGITSVTILNIVLKAYGASPKPFIPKRSSEGYGLSLQGIKRCFEENGTPDLLITVDCGTNSAAEIDHLRKLGTEVIVIDHHEPDPNENVAAVSIVNPKPSSGFEYLCAAGVVFKVAHALLKTHPIDFDLKDIIQFVALATVADIVPLVGENRIFVRYGLLRLERSQNMGLRALKNSAGLDGRIFSSDIGFRIGPRINAAGRMDSPETAVELLTTKDENRALELAQILETFNTKRQTYEKQIRQEAIAQLEELDAIHAENELSVIVLGSREWHPGVVGIVASRLMRQFYKPTFIVAIDENGIGKASGRSIEGVSLVQAIRECKDDLISGGGHDMAAGLSVHENSLANFRSSFSDFVYRQSTPEDRIPKLKYDTLIPLESLTLDFLNSYELLQPFGNANPQPVFVSSMVDLAAPPHHLKNKHLRFILQQNGHQRDAIFFGAGDRELPKPPWDVAFQINRNTFRGDTSLQIVIQDVRSAQPFP